MRVVSASLLAFVLFAFCGIGTATAQTWTGRATPNMSNGMDKANKQCGPVNYTVVRDGTKINIHLDYATISRDLSADQAADGSFSTTYVNINGNTIPVFGKIAGDSGEFNIAPAALCGYKDIPLKH
ncbi:MAG TPA: hypothetical protein VN821_12435 [Candidatus Udaeobacter sp.]|nr:hypothetical protein [Candidatus Udaeobacter sp.]